MSKYIIELGEDAKAIQSISITSLGNVYVDSWYVENLEELNSDYINEHYGDPQAAYNKGLHDGESKCRYCNEYQRGLDDAWDAARKIVDLWTRIDNDELLAIFGITERIGHSTINSLFGKQTVNEAMLTLEAYEEKQKQTDDEIKVGDIVERYLNGKLDSTGIYLGEDGDYWNCLFWTGAVFGTFAYPKNQFKKTEKHVDIASILEAMKT